jgi:hypothetical protein
LLLRVIGITGLRRPLMRLMRLLRLRLLLRLVPEFREGIGLANQPRELSKRIVTRCRLGCRARIWITSQSLIIIVRHSIPNPAQPFAMA